VDRPIDVLLLEFRDNEIIFQLVKLIANINRLDHGNDLSRSYTGWATGIQELIGWATGIQELILVGSRTAAAVEEL